MTTSELLHQLIAATPARPPEADIDALLAAFEAVVAERAQIFEQLEVPLQLADADRPLMHEIERRDAIWQDALTAALRQVGEQRHANGQVRAYAVSL